MGLFDTKMTWKWITKSFFEAPPDAPIPYEVVTQDVVSQSFKVE